MELEFERRTVESPISGKLFPDDDRWKFGCCGLDNEGLTEFERACCEVYGGFRMSLLELERLIAEAGCGIPE